MNEFWFHFRKNRVATAGVALLALLAVLAVAGPIVLPLDPFSMNAAPLQPPSFAHPMGTDELGRDVLARFIHGARVSLTIGLLSALISVAIGVAIGATAGFFGGIVDQVLMRAAEFFHVIPRFFLALVLVALFGSSYAIIVLVIGLLSWPNVARLTRSEFLTLRERDYVAAARAVGVGKTEIIFGEILPNAAPALIVICTLQFSLAILLEASLSFIGLGDPTFPSWGQMLNAAQQIIRQAPWVSLFPGLGIFVAVAALNLVGDGLNDALNPHLRNR